MYIIYTHDIYGQMHLYTGYEVEIRAGTPVAGNQIDTARVDVVNSVTISMTVVIHSFPTDWARIFLINTQDARSPGIWIKEDSDDEVNPRDLLLILIIKEYGIIKKDQHLMDMLTHYKH